MSGTGFTAAIVSPVIAGLVADRLHSWDLTFVLSIGVMLFGIGRLTLQHKINRIDASAVF
ncbi:hypothetical protein [Paraburkholderia sp. UCT31]|nr:hypothetical protein [Paraburkholderia sp. UCT31]